MAGSSGMCAQRPQVGGWDGQRLPADEPIPDEIVAAVHASLGRQRAERDRFIGLAPDRRRGADDGALGSLIGARP